MIQYKMSPHSTVPLRVTQDSQVPQERPVLQGYVASEAAGVPPVLR